MTETCKSRVDHEESLRGLLKGCKIREGEVMAPDPGPELRLRVQSMQSCIISRSSHFCQRRNDSWSWKAQSG